MNTPHIQHCKSMADLPALRAGGIVYIIFDGANPLGTYFAAKGFTVQEWAVNAATLGDYCGASVRTLPDATRLVVAVGGWCAMQVGKLVAQQAQRPLWCVPTHPGATGALWCHTWWVVGNHPKLLDAAPHALMMVDSLFAEDRQGQELAYQCLTACYVSLVMDIFRARIEGAEQDNAPRHAAMDEVRQTLLACREYTVGQSAALWRALEKAAPHTDLAEIELFALTICMYKSQKFEYNKYMCLACIALAAALSEWPDVPDLYLPPDRGQVAGAIQGMGWRPCPTAQKQAAFGRLDWTWRNFLPDAQAALKDVDEMARVWRRLVGAAGYDYFAGLTPQDVAALLPVVAELNPTYTPLKHLYQRGGLNRFI